MPEETPEPDKIDQALSDFERRLVRVRNIALTAVATVAAVGAVGIAIIDQWNTARAHYLERKTIELELADSELKQTADALAKKTEEIDEHLENTDEVVTSNEKRLNETVGAPEAVAAPPAMPVSGMP